MLEIFVRMVNSGKKYSKQMLEIDVFSMLGGGGVKLAPAYRAIVF